MPTGYTAQIYEGNTDFTDFVIRSAHAFIPHMRDSSMNDKLELLSEDSYYSKEKKISEAKKNIDKALQEISMLENATDEEINKIIDKNYSEDMNRYNDTLDKNKILRKNYEKVLHDVEAWEPPTSKHHNLKNFMIKQIQDSIEFDAGEPRKPVKPSVEEYRLSRISTENRMLKHYTEDLQKAQDSVDPNEWIRDLIESLPNGQDYIN